MNPIALSCLLLGLALPAAAIEAPVIAVKQPIGHAAYASWRSIQGTALSRDGRWTAYALVAQEADGELVVRRLADGQEWRAPRGTAPVFSADGRYLAFAVQPTRSELDQARKDKRKPEDQPKPGAAWMDLATGKVESVARVKRFAWPEDAGTQLAVLLETAKDEKKPARKDEKAEKADDDQLAPDAASPGAARKKESGSELILIAADAGTRRSFKDVAEFQWARNGERLAFSVSVKDVKAAEKSAEKIDTAREGVYLVDFVASAEGSAKALLTGAGSYRQLQFDDAGLQLAFLSNRDHVAAQSPAKVPDNASDKASDKDDKTPSPFKLFFWKLGKTEVMPLVSAGTPGLPTDWTPSEHGALNFSKDGQRLFLGTALLPKAEPKDAPEPLKVDLWHWQDPELQSVQKVQAEKEKQRSYRAVVHLGGNSTHFVQLATLDVPTLIVNENARFALGSSELPYRPLQSWDGSYRDVYAVDLQTGAKRLLARKLRLPPKLSPAGQYLLAFEPLAKTWFAWRLSDGEKINLTGKIRARFDNLDRDVPAPAEPYGVAGWTADDDAVVLYDQFDLWAVQVSTGTARNLSAGYGRKQQLTLRVVPLDPDEPDSKPLPSEGLLLSATHEHKRSTGFYRLPVAAGDAGGPVKLIHADKLIGGLIKAKDADALVFTQQSYTEFPDLWASTLALNAAQKISAANPQQGGYHWGTQELIEYRAANGKKLRALLSKPDDFDPRKKYPLIVYIYEKMTDKLHQYVPPAPSQNINVTRYTSQGYLVLRPDIEYTTGHPGRSAMDTVLPAIKQLQAKGFVDAQRIGIQGHSWGAYQINHLITHTNIFAAAEAGASMANMISGYGGIRWGTGVSRAVQYEQGQSRMGTTPWSNPQLYVENSPIFRVNHVTTPYLTIHNDEDDAVPWYQAIEFFTALRRLGKEAYWFNYNGAKHGLRDREQMKHYTVHMAEFFDHYLLGAPRAGWMDKPVPYLERGKRDVMPMFKPAETRPN